MDKRLIFLFLILSFILISKASEEEDLFGDIPYEDPDGDYFKESLKSYLVEKQLFDSERIIPKEEMERIFIDIITEGDPEGAAEYMGEVFKELAKHFMKIYYKDGKEIRGKDIYNLIDINAISMEFQRMIGDDEPYYDDEEEYDFDKQDVVGGPSPGL